MRRPAHDRETSRQRDREAAKWAEKAERYGSRRAKATARRFLHPGDPERNTDHKSRLSGARMNPSRRRNARRHRMAHELRLRLRAGVYIGQTLTLHGQSGVILGAEMRGQTVTVTVVWQSGKVRVCTPWELADAVW